MPAEVSKIIENLFRSVLMINAIVQNPPIEPREARPALSNFRDSLSTAVQNAQLWLALALPNSDPGPFLSGVATAFSSAHAGLLRACKYDGTFPPTASDLLTETENSVLYGAPDPQWGADHVSRARAYLGKYVQELSDHIREGRYSQALAMCRRLGPIPILLLALTHAEVTVGDDFSIRPIFSTHDFIKVEVTIPDRRDALLHLINGGASAAASTIESAQAVRELPQPDRQPPVQQRKRMTHTENTHRGMDSPGRSGRS